MVPVLRAVGAALRLIKRQEAGGGPRSERRTRNKADIANLLVSVIHVGEAAGLGLATLEEGV